MSGIRDSKPGHTRNDSAVGVDDAPADVPADGPADASADARPGSVGSFTAADFADYEKRLAAGSIVKPGSAHVQLPRRPDCDMPVRPMSMPVYYVNGFTGPVFADYEKRMSAFAKQKAADIEAVNDSELTLEASDEDKYPLPVKRQLRYVRQARHRVLSVYRRLATVIITANMIPLVWLLSTKRTIALPPEDLATATAVNFFITVLVRQEYMVNALYASCLAVPLSTPLRLRRILAKVYENGGVHSGTAYSGTIWFIILCASLTVKYVNNQLAVDSSASLGVAYFTLGSVLLLLGFALPVVRMRFHNLFEYTHRFGGWLTVALLWALLILLGENNRVANKTTLGVALSHQPSFYFLIGITVHLILPWVFLRKVTFNTQNLSNHAVRLNFNEKLSPFRGVAIAKSPLSQYHSFATFPDPDSGHPDGQSIIVSRAGDWTAEQVGDGSATRHYWLRGFPKTGVLGMSLIFRRVVIVTTGSGIGPCLAFLNLPENLRRPCHVIWSSPRPKEIYGEGICDSVRKCDRDALIWDTKRDGRPNMVKLTYELYCKSGAEAVFVISNPGLTRKIVYGMESRGIPAFGPIWDS